MTKNYSSSSVPRFGDRSIEKKFKLTDVGVTRFSPDGQFLSVGRIEIAELADFRILLAISHQRSTAIEPQSVAGHIMRELTYTTSTVDSTFMRRIQGRVETLR